MNTQNPFTLISPYAAEPITVSAQRDLSATLASLNIQAEQSIQPMKPANISSLAGRQLETFLMNNINQLSANNKPMVQNPLIICFTDTSLNNCKLNHLKFYVLSPGQTNYPPKALVAAEVQNLPREWQDLFFLIQTCPVSEAPFHVLLGTLLTLCVCIRYYNKSNTV
jgi:hypothetical protein